MCDYKGSADQNIFQKSQYHVIHRQSILKIGFEMSEFPVQGRSISPRLPSLPTRSSQETTSRNRCANLGIQEASSNGKTGSNLLLDYSLPIEKQTNVLNI